MKRVIFGLMLTLLTISILSWTFNIKPTKGEWTGTVYIKADGSTDPPDAPITKSDDNVTYTLTDNITIPGYNYGVVVQRDNVVIDGAGYTLQGSQKGGGFSLSGRNNVTIKNANIENVQVGISLDFSSNISIIGNNVTLNNEYGIRLEYSSENSVSENNITANTYYGILARASNNRISANKIADNAYGISLDTSSYNSISGNNITNNERGISLSYSPRNNITENNLINNDYGIVLVGYSPDYTNRIYHNNLLTTQTKRK